jgi:transcriptional regulator with XRE-family HTH domain
MARSIPPPLGLSLTLLRLVRGWTQTDLAKASGVVTSQLSQYESGKTRLTRERLDQLAAVMGTDDGASELVIGLVSLLYALNPGDSRDRQPGAAPPGPGAPPGIPEQAAQAADPGADPFAPTPVEQRLTNAFVMRMTRVLSEVLQGHTARLVQAHRAQAERQDADSNWQALKSRTPAERRLLLEHGFHLQTWAMSMRLCEESERAAARSAAEALELATLGLRAAQLALGEPAWLARLQGYAWAFVGNARRVGGNLPAADQAFATARKLWDQGAEAGNGEVEEWRLCDLEASLRRDQRQWSTALALLERARQLAPPEAAGRILVKKATVLVLVDETEAALAALDEAAPLVEAGTDPRLRWSVRYNQITCLCRLGRYQEAESRLSGVSQPAVELDNRLDLLRLLWLRAHVAAGKGERQDAIDGLERVRAEFTTSNNSYETALVSIELAILYLEEGRVGEARELARSMIRIFHSQRVHREALAALRLFSQGLEAETINLEQLRGIHLYLERARHQPGLDFETFLLSRSKRLEEKAGAPAV